VHARGQCFHFDANWAHEPEKLIRALHSILPTSVRIKSVKSVSDDFHARFSVSGKRYLYNYYLGRADPVDDRYLWACRDLPLELEVMQAAADRLLGTHDFSAYSATHGKENDPNPVKTVTRLQLRQRGKFIRLDAEGTGFLYRMVRSIAGALYAVGRGRLTPDDIAEILESKKRTHRIVTAPAKGLFLDRVFYA
jgi:tRNA pseudouridine38-40 synthase